MKTPHTAHLFIVGRVNLPIQTEMQEDSGRMWKTKATVPSMYALNFYSDLYLDVLRANRKTLTIRLGDKRSKYQDGEIVWITIGQRFGRRQKLFAAVIDRAEVKTISELSRREIERENPEFRSHEDVIALLGRIYNDQISPEHLVTVVHFSPIDE